ncbi:hydroxyisourate hydrolase [Ornithinimicrobium pekingense]|uniref:5-hydroxyisourate hydrolase n=1 Tax=Ornithinimicrobium pekingense TaxID=384677 RepID=A0ABQ2FAK0_9MICO|nr:hydroxyisourate hydrolase [Ornithinimicrobium pekingense]GGK69945.1 5-hydroxyisourate hydrolase [Ornithinimicrobium pekingense]
MATLSTHVLDTALGRPARGVRVELTTLDGAPLGEGTTDEDGRVGSIGPALLPPGDYVLTFGTGAYHAATGQEGFYPSVPITFTIGADEHFHVPLLLNPFGYSTYRGS